jgi:hypothetical protein
MSDPQIGNVTIDLLRRAWESGREYGRNEKYGRSIRLAEEVTKPTFEEWVMDNYGDIVERMDPNQ